MKKSALGAALNTFLGVSFALSSSAYAIREDGESERLAARESADLPAPGEHLLRTATKADTTESSVFAAGVVLRHDALDGSFRLLSGRAGLSLVSALGGEASYTKWIKAADRSEKNRAALRAQVEALSRRFVAKHKGELGFRSSDLRLNEGKFFADAEHVFLSFDVVIEGVFVKGSSVDFRFTQGELVQVAARTFGAATSEAARAAARSALTSRAMSDVATAKRVLGPMGAVSEASQPVLFVTAEEGARAYSFTAARRLEAVSATGERFAVVASADGTKVLEWNSLHLKITADIEGVVVNRAPGDGTSVRGLPFAQASSGGPWGWGKKTYTANEKGRIEANGAKNVTFNIVSPYFKVKNSSGQSAAIKPSGDSGNILFDAESNSTLAETSAFYHLNVARAYVKGFISTKWFDSQVGVNVNINDKCNAFWNGNTANFFQKGTATKNGKTLECRNTGEIADVMYHEWGHGLDQNTGGIEDGAYSEGIGDINAMMLTHSSKIGPGFFADGTPVRDLEGEYSYPKDKGEVHKEGLIIGSSWWHLTGELEAKYGKDVGHATAARYFYKSLFTTSQYTDVYNALLAIDSDGSEADRGPNFCLINKAFARHGLAAKDSSCLM